MISLENSQTQQLTHYIIVVWRPQGKEVAQEPLAHKIKIFTLWSTAESLQIFDLKH